MRDCCTVTMNFSPRSLVAPEGPADLFGDDHDPPEREKEVLQGVRTVLEFAEKI